MDKSNKESGKLIFVNFQTKKVTGKSNDIEDIEQFNQRARRLLDKEISEYTTEDMNELHHLLNIGRF